MAKSSKMDPLEAAKITDERIATDKAALGATMPIDPTRPAPLQPSATVPPGQFVPPENKPLPPPPLRNDGPTIEEWVVAGYEASAYPPVGYAEKPSSGLTLYKAGSPIPDEYIDQARVSREERAAPPRRVLFVVQQDIRVSVGKGQIAMLRKGTELDLAGYGEHGIQRIVDQGAKLERQER